MEENLRREPAAEQAVPAFWARMEAGYFGRSWWTLRQAGATAALTLYTLPEQRGVRLFAALTSLALEIGCLAASFSVLAQGIRPALWLCAAPYLLLLLLLCDPFYLILVLRLRRSLRRFAGATLSPAGLHLEGDEGGRDYPLAELTLVRRLKHWTVLVWRREEELLALPVPDAVCPEGGEALLTRLREAAPQAVLVRRHRPALRWLGRVLAGIFHLAVCLTAFLLFLAAHNGLQVLTYSNWGAGATVTVSYDHQAGTIRLGDADPIPVTGDLKFLWQTDTCGALTYQRPDGTLGVLLVDGTLDQSALRLDPDPPTGRWQQYNFSSDPGVTLEWDADAGCYRLLTGSGEAVYPRWQSFDGLGIALCDEAGEPHWTVTAARGTNWSSDGLLADSPALLLCPVTMEDDPTYYFLYPAEEQADS